MSYDIIGNIAILKSQKLKISDDYQKSKNKRFLKPRKGNKKLALKLMKENKNIKTILEKKDKVKGRLRTIKTRFIAGIKTKEAVYSENNCKFKLNVESCYFSPRLAGERKEIAELIKKKDKVLVLFAGVAPFSIVIGKFSKCKKVVSVELGRECSRYAKKNVELNKLKNVEVVQGDVKKLNKLIKKEKFDVVIMPRPQLKESFLSYIFPFIRKNTRIFYYDFCREEELGLILSKIKREFESKKVKYKVVRIKRAGEIAPYKFRFRVDLVVN